MTLEYLTVANCLLKVAVTITNENDARLYQAFLGQIYIQAKEEENELLHQWWLGFWMIVGSKVPNVAIDHLEYLLDDTLNSKRMDLVHLLVVRERASCASSRNDTDIYSRCSPFNTRIVSILIWILWPIRSLLIVESTSRRYNLYFLPSFAHIRISFNPSRSMQSLQRWKLFHSATNCLY